ncbi:MAG: hypothetical protein JW856_05145 [Dehalococcoidales bacterium]|nr:hypothetical protein [Dehalococcoidales bacterium]
MARKKKFIIAGVVMATLAVLGTIGGVALADDSTDANPASTFVAKVASILGIEQSTVQAAFDQAQEEMRSEALDNWLAQMVTDGKITQEQADAYKAWIDAKPSGFEGLGMGFGGGMRGGRGGFMCPPAVADTD